MKEIGPCLKLSVNPLDGEAVGSGKQGAAFSSYEEDMELGEHLSVSFSLPLPANFMLTGKTCATMLVL